MKRDFWAVALVFGVGCGGTEADLASSSDEIQALADAAPNVLPPKGFPVGINFDAFSPVAAACLMTSEDEAVCAIPNAAGTSATLVTGNAAYQLAGTMSLGVRFDHVSYAEFTQAFDDLGEDRLADIVTNIAYGPMPETALAASGPGFWSRLGRAIKKLFRRRRETRDPPSIRRRPRPWPDAEDCRLRSQDALENCEGVILTPIKDSDGNIVAYYDQLGRIH